MSTWQKTKHTSKAAFDAGWAAFEKLGAPVNKVTNKIGSEAFWPTSLGPECDKAARVLKSFCKDGFYTDAPDSTFSPNPKSPGPKNKPKVLVKIPQKAIQNCVGLAIFTVMRTGLWVSGAGGSGVLIARREDGSWSPPSGILIHTLGVGFMAGIDIYDCVCVINSREALKAFSKVRVSLGGEVSVVAGPLGAGGVIESEAWAKEKGDRKPVWSYMKSRGLYGGVQIDGTVIIERNDENAKFYGERVGVSEILKGNVRLVPKETRLLMEVLKQAEGRTDLDHGVLQHVDTMPTPGDVEVEKLSEPSAQQQQNFAPPPDFQHPHQGSGKHEEQGPAYPPRPVTKPGDEEGLYYYPPPPPGPPPANQPQYYPPPPGPPPTGLNQSPYHPAPATQAGSSGSAPYYPPPPNTQELDASPSSEHPPAYQAPTGGAPAGLDHKDPSGSYATRYS